MFDLHVGNVLDVLPTLPGKSVQTCVTSPPYFGLRDYGNDGQIGLEQTPDDYVQKLVQVFREVKRVLRDDGTVWLNLGDSFGPNKQLMMIPARVVLALQADGWILRMDCIWHKPNPMPESVRDRPTKAHEYLFLLSKQSSYYYGYETIKEPLTESTINNLGARVRGKSPSSKAGIGQPQKLGGRSAGDISGRNRRSVWSVSTRPFKGAHFAVFPPKLIEPCILAGAPVGGTVLDPFTGSGTTGIVAAQHGRAFVGIELNPTYAETIARPRLEQAYGQTSLFANAAD